MGSRRSARSPAFRRQTSYSRLDGSTYGSNSAYLLYASDSMSAVSVTSDGSGGRPVQVHDRSAFDFRSHAASESQISRQLCPRVRNGISWATCCACTDSPIEARRGGGWTTTACGAVTWIYQRQYGWARRCPFRDVRCTMPSTRRCAHPATQVPVSPQGSPSTHRRLADTASERTGRDVSSRPYPC